MLDSFKNCLRVFKNRVQPTIFIAVTCGVEFVGVCRFLNVHCSCFVAVQCIKKVLYIIFFLP